MKRRLKVIVSFIIILLSLLVTLATEYWRKNLPLLSPIDLIENLPPVVSLFGPKQPSKIVYGFFPYWNLKQARSLNIKGLTHFAYFGVDLNPDGSLKKFDRPGELEPGWSKLDSLEFLLLKRQLKILNKKVILVVRGMENDLIEQIVNNPAKSQKAIEAIVKLTNDQQFDGLNIDLEYVGTPDKRTKNNFTVFVKNIAAKCKLANPKCEISVDILADTAAKDRLHDLSVLTPFVDQFIIMAYDFYRPSSPQAGPVAPLRGKCASPPVTPCLEYDVVTAVSDIGKLVPTEKIILGVPFYGYEWQVASPRFLANAYPKSGGLASYKRIQNLIADPPDPTAFALSWSDLTQSPYLTYQENGSLFQIHYENTLSLRLKLDLIRQANLAGIAIWALGYETPYLDLWETITRFLPPF